MGAGPAGIYTADNLVKSRPDAQVDLFERLPAPFGLVRYGVAPDHPRIKGIVQALEQIMARGQLRLFGNVAYGTDIKLDELRAYYDAVVLSTGADQDRALDIPGIELPGSFGAADFVSWYDGHPDVPRTWPLDATQVAVLGAGNVALDVARMLAKTADELSSTEIPPNVYRGLASSAVTDVHVFGRRGPAQAKFTPLELRELDHSPNVEVVVDPADIEFDAGSLAEIRAHRQTELVVKTLQEWAIREPGDRPYKLHLHFLQAPVAVLGTDRVSGLRTERTELTGDGTVRGTGELRDWPVGQVYRAVGYLSSHAADLPFDHRTGTIPNQAGRILDLDGEQIPGMYTTGWIKRGPVGLIGHTKGDALETVQSLLADEPLLARAPNRDPAAIEEFLSQRGISYTDWPGWRRINAHEMALGERTNRERVKVVDRAELLTVARESC
ncbi:FAD-dependent oxidoreductase [Tamaricihabitans halophyticus]|uniref:FAD-dependent oxidoreductase n=1 Tax=Tamaricihabitans halophyticus TaxID=1262583 RepID=UPI0010448D47|nr:FAD-dependent oxidoreductase [Tamaricihabitans halophyticus]